MKRYLFLVLAILPVAALAQKLTHNTYVDALRLTSLYKKYQENPGRNAGTLKVEFDKILSGYASLQSFENHPILQEEYRIHLLPDAMVVGGNKGLPGNKPADDDLAPGMSLAVKEKGSLGWQEAVVNGLADFMAGRFRQEVLHYGLKNVFSRISKEDMLIFRALLPNTLREVQKLDGGSNYYSADLLFLRQIVQTDLQELEHRLISERHTVFPVLPGSPQVEDMLLVGYHTYAQARQEKNLPDIITALSRETYATPEMAEAWKLTALLSDALRDTAGSTQLWVDPSQLSGNLGKDNLVPVYFFALLLEQLKADETGKKLLSGLPSASTYFEQVRPMMRCFKDLNTAYGYLKSKGNKLKDISEGVEFLRLMNAALQTFIETPEVSTYVYRADEAARKAIPSYLRISKPFLEKNYQQAIPVLLTEMSAYLPEGEKYKRSVVFMTQLASVEKSEDMEYLLQSYALPIGGSSIKRNSRWNISLNGYVGAAGGFEKAYGSLQSPTKGNVGLSAPIGISVTRNKNFTLFASFIDIGSVVSLRLNNDNNEYAALRLEHFLAPGLGLFYNVKNTPLSLGLHQSYVPNLRNISYQDNNATITDENVSVNRVNFSVLVDIPFLTFFNKTL